MDSQFWIKAWNEGRTNFHQKYAHEKLIEYFPRLHPQEEQKVLVPLCGKSKDLLWLHDLNLYVHGIELHEGAVIEFFKENEFQPVKKEQDQNFTHYSYGNVAISSGDLFKLSQDEVYDFVYDRASLVALPAMMRKQYAEVIKRSLKIGGKYLLIVYEYDQTKMDGPPFSVDEAEVRELYKDQFSIELVESNYPTQDGPRVLALEKGIKQNIYILERLS